MSGRRCEAGAATNRPARLLSEPETNIGYISSGSKSTGRFGQPIVVHQRFDQRAFLALVLERGGLLGR